MSEDIRMNGEPRGSGMTSAAAGFMLGALVGAGVALLLAPAAGEDTRRRLGSVAARAGDAARDGLGRAKDMVSHLKGDTEDAIDAGREVAHHAKEEIRSRFKG